MKIFSGNKEKSKSADEDYVEEDLQLKVWHFRGMLLPIKGLVAVVGGILLMVALSVDFSYSNLNTYVISYLRANGSPDTTYAEWQWVSTAKNVVGGGLMPVGGIISRKMGTTFSVTVGSIIYTAGYALTYLTLDMGLPMVTLTMGVMHGIGFSLVYAQCLGSVMKWFPANPGLMASLAVSGYGFGGVIWNPLETAFVNPDNVDAQTVEGEEDKYFLDEELLERVPDLFLLLAGVFAAMQIPGILLLRLPNQREVAAIAKMDAEMEEDEKRSAKKKTDDASDDKYSISSSDMEKSSVKEEETTSDKAQPYSVRPKDMMKTKEFYILWFSYFANQFSNGLFLSYAKSYGQIYISDDAFLSTAYTVSQVFNGSCRIIWGKLYDKLNFQRCIVFISGFMAFLNFTFVDLSIFPDDSGSAKAFYMIWIILVYATYPGIYSVYAPTTMNTYGPEHYDTNYGILFTINFVYSFLLLVMTEFAYDAIGYTGLFFFAGGMETIGMVIAYFFPDNLTSDDFKERFENKS